ncbi:MAG: ATP-binding protein [Armatimonadota bacterium]
MAKLLPRESLTDKVRSALRARPIVALLGPRQCGKTTVAKGIAADRSGDYFDLEEPLSLARLAQPMTTLAEIKGLIVIDEVQRQPGLFPLLRVFADRRPARAKFLILGSASPELIRNASETLAGRVAFIEMGGFDLGEVGTAAQRKLWLRGGFPRAFLARSDAESLRWREDFIRTFLERDIPQLGIRIPAAALRRLWMMLTHYSGQVLNASEIGRSLGEAHTTVKRHLDLLCGALVVRQVEPWFENLGKRQVKAPKVYVRDSGILHALLGVPSLGVLQGHPKLGASWEGFVVEEVVRIAGERHAYYWATQAGAELDLLLMLRGKRYGVEVKYADAPRLSRSMATALADLKLDRTWVVYPGDQRYQLHERVEAISLSGVREELSRLAPKHGR